jgi:hypothetical protein
MQSEIRSELLDSVAGIARTSPYLLPLSIDWFPMIACKFSGWGRRYLKRGDSCDPTEVLFQIWDRWSFPAFASFWLSLSEEKISSDHDATAAMR